MAFPEEGVNARIVAYLDRLAGAGGVVHPDVENRMTELSAAEGLIMQPYANTQVILRGETVVAAAFGTAYVLKSGSCFAAAVDAGAETIRLWSDGSSLDLSLTFGADWVSGNWHPDEATWIASN